MSTRTTSHQASTPAPRRLRWRQQPPRAASLRNLTPLSGFSLRDSDVPPDLQFLDQYLVGGGTREDGGTATAGYWRGAKRQLERAFQERCELGGWNARGTAGPDLPATEREP
jgi:hypothetical protein